jgi:hypothetical protein
MGHLIKKLTYFLFTITILASNDRVSANEYQFIGKFLLEYSIFKIDVYEISYYKSPNGSEKLLLDYQMDVKKKYSQQGWTVGLKFKTIIPKYKTKAQWLLDNTIDLLKGDKLSIIKNKFKVTLLKNDKLVATIIDPIIAELAFEPWLGTNPVSLELKNSLLGLNKEK